MDLWLIVCFFFTFLVLVEFCIIIALSRPNPLPNSVPKGSKKLWKQRSRQTRDSEIRQRSTEKDHEDTDDDEDEVDKKFERRRKKQKHMAAVIETTFKFFLPVVHLLFLIIFFSCYAGKKTLLVEKGITYEPINVLEVAI